ncbi:hypothetical protein AKO1_012441 [Acrasis kona]|uniref:Protein kinase domain-containing protein n=1 Tax=Acrasis kona TaxID=1008807 RepID=A0AAW2YWB5_9EUKA
MLTGGVPYPDLAGERNQYTIMYKLASSNRIPLIPDHVGSDARNFLMRCFQIDPEKRATVDELLNHPFVNEPVDPSLLIQITAPAFIDQHLCDFGSFISYDGSDEDTTSDCTSSTNSFVDKFNDINCNPTLIVSHNLVNRRFSTVERYSRLSAGRRPSLGMFIGDDRLALRRGSLQASAKKDIIIRSPEEHKQIRFEMGSSVI